MSDAFKGLIGGAVLGGVVGRYVSIWFMLEPIWFAGDWIAMGAAVGGFLGFIGGDKFFELAGDFFGAWV